MRSFLLALIATAICTVSLAADAAYYTVDVVAPGETVIQVAGQASEPMLAQPVGTNEDGEKASASGRRRLSLRERQAAGFTFSNTQKIRQELLDGGFITPDMSAAEVTVMVTGIIIADAKSSTDPVLVGIDWDNIDWDAVFAFIERLIQLIMMFF